MNLRYKNIINLLLTIIFVFFILMISTIFVTKSKFIYYKDIDNLEITKMSGLKVNEIKLNYDYTINYLFDETITEFKPPTLNSSEDGSQHFKEVRDLFNLGMLILKSSGILAAILIYISIRNKYFDFKFLKYSAMTILCIPVLSLLFINIDFNSLFTVFHKMLFNNDKWLLDPAIDPIINIMPEEFFAHCAIAIVSISSIMAMIFLVIYYFFKSKYSQRKSNI